MLVQMFGGGGTFCLHVQVEGLRLTLSFSHSENGGSKVFGNVELMCNPTECNNPLRSSFEQHLS